MNLRAVGRMLGIVLLLIAGFLLVPGAVGLAYREYAAAGQVGLSALVVAAAGVVLARTCRGSSVTAEGRPDFFRREGLAVVGLSWLVGGVAGAVPYVVSGALDSPVDAFFEAVSGFTTTGSTVMSAGQIEGMSRTIAFWRSFTHWLGGFGIVLVFVVLFPTGGRSLFRSEVPGISREAGHQRVRDSALTLLRIYVGISVIEWVLLMTVGGMDPYDAGLHTFGTIATGGFSNHSASIAFYDSVSVELILTLFMFVCGFNFALYDTLLRVGPRPYWRSLIGSSEAKAYVGIAVVATLVLATWLWFTTASGDQHSNLAGDPRDYRSWWQAVRDSTFTVVCLQTSTGYGTANFDAWPQGCRVLCMFLAVIGACAGSTGGGLKVVRFLIVAKAALVGVRRFARPRAIHAVRMDGHTLDGGIVASVTSYFVLWVLVFLATTLFLTAFGTDLETAATAVLATLNNIGPGLARVGPTANYAEFNDLVKVVLTGCMILGRLEFYALVVLFVPSFWRQ